MKSWGSVPSDKSSVGYIDMYIGYLGGSYKCLCLCVVFSCAFLRYESLLRALDPSAPATGQVRKCLKELAPDSQIFLNNLFKKKRQAADHAMVIMVADERRRQKPYAVPVQLVPYHSIRDQQLQGLLENCHAEARKLGLIPVGKYLLEVI